jgi:hypothetical protein
MYGHDDFGYAMVESALPGVGAHLLDNGEATCFDFPTAALSR